MKSFGAEEREDARLARVVGKWRMRVRRTWMRFTISSTVQLVVLLCLRAAVIGGALLLWMAGNASPGEVTYVLTSYFVIHGYLRDIGFHVNNLQRSVNDMEELVAIHDEVPRHPRCAGCVPTDRSQGGNIVFDHVTFHYGGQRRRCIATCRWTSAPASAIGLVGRSGSGKTTFVKLVQRLYDVSGGRILIDGQDVARRRRHRCAARSRSCSRSRSCFTARWPTTSPTAGPAPAWRRSSEAARLANAHEFIERLPNGYGTLVGERGVKLSGGERQRVALARAFLADAPILILDEATSSLDFGIGGADPGGDGAADAGPHVDRDRAPAVDGARLDRILVFDRGEIVEEGTHAALAAPGRHLPRPVRAAGAGVRPQFGGGVSKASSFRGASTGNVIPGHIQQVARDLLDANPESRDSGFTPSAALCAIPLSCPGIDSNSSCPGLSRASTSWLPLSKKDVDGRDKPGHDDGWQNPRRAQHVPCYLWLR